MNSRLLSFAAALSLLAACREDVPLGRNNTLDGAAAGPDAPPLPDTLSPPDAAPDVHVRPDALDAGADAPAPPDALPPIDAASDLPAAPVDLASESPPDDAPAPIAQAVSCATCPAGTVLCFSRCSGPAPSRCGICVPLDPVTGCSNCFGPCTFAHASAARCDGAGACVLGACDPGWGNCDGDASNGCEASLRRNQSCGQCGMACPAGQRCTPTGCQSACTPPLTLCSDGECVDLTTDHQRCGGCGTACGSNQVCRGGSCQDPLPSSCAGTMCGDQCVDLASNPAHCGACGKSCFLERDSRKGGHRDVCRRGVCARVCGPGFTTCGADCVALSADPEHCGACGRACAATEVCLAGNCAPAASLRLATGQMDPMDLAVDGDAVYWTDVTEGAIKRVSKAGGAVTTIASGQARPSRLALDATHVYWTNALGASVMRAPKAGGATELLSSAVQPTDLTVVGDFVYWVNHTDSSAHTLELRKVPRAGGTSTQVVACGIYEYQPVDPSLPQVTFLVRDGALLYLMCGRPDVVFGVVRIDTASADAQQSLEGERLYRGARLALSGSHIYYLAGGTSVALHSLDRVSGQAGLRYVLSSSLGNISSPGQMVASACGLYWWSFGAVAGTRDFMSFEGWGPVAIPRGVVDPRRTVVDGGYVYWTEQGGVARMPVP